MIKKVTLIFSDEEKVGKGEVGSPRRRTYKLVTEQGVEVICYDPHTNTTITNGKELSRLPIDTNLAH